jgi:hypothetical protein
LKSELATHCREGTWRCALDLAGRQGFELGARRFHQLVMARDFWFQTLQTEAVNDQSGHTSVTFNGSSRLVVSSHRMTHQ